MEKIEGKVSKLPVRGTLGQRLAARRARLFVGREAERERFADFADADSEQVLWFLFGPGGIGKSTLLWRMRDTAEALGSPCLIIDARTVQPNPPAVRHALAQAAGNRTLAQFSARHQRPLLLIDSFEYWQDLEPWLRQELLPGLPGNLGVVIAGRRAPADDWQRQPGWSGLIMTTQLEALSGDECASYLGLRDIPTTQFEPLLRFSGGHPLALAMAADAAAAVGELKLGDASGESVYQTLLKVFTREAEHSEQVIALDACAVAHEMTEDLLARMLGRDDARECYAWLAGLSCIEPGRKGLVPHDIVRGVLMHTMATRAPGRYQALARIAVNWVVERMEGESWLAPAQAARLGAQAMFALRRVPMVQHYLAAEGAFNLYVDRVRSDADWAALADMTLRHEGPESCAWFEFWRQRYPENVTVVRGIQGQARAYILRLDMEALCPDERSADPFTRCLWQAIETRFGARPGDRIAFHRFWVNHDYAASGSPEKTQMMMSITSHNLTTPNLRLTAQLFGTRTPSWPQQARAIGLHLLEDSAIRIGEHVYQIFYNDWVREPPMRHYRLFADRCLAFERTMGGLSAAAPVSQPLSRDAFKAAVVDALRDLHRPGKLERNPLLGSALVLAANSPDQSDGVNLLVEQVKTAAAELVQAGERGRRLHRVLVCGYLAPAHSQKQAAAALHMGYSTYRRQLASARDAISEVLWRRERAQRAYPQA